MIDLCDVCIHVMNHYHGILFLNVGVYLFIIYVYIVSVIIITM